MTIEQMNLIYDLAMYMEKPRYRIQWDCSDEGSIIGFWLWTCNRAAINLQPSTYYPL